MLKYITYLDAFGTTFQFTTMKDSKFRTPVGGILSILSLIVIIIFCFVFGRDFFFKKNPRVLTQIVVPDKYNDPFRMTVDIFVVPWRMADENNLPVNFENIFYPVITYYRYTMNSTGPIPIYNKIIDVVKCNETYAKVSEFTEKFPVKDYYCMDWSKDNYTFGGHWDGHYLHYFELKFHFCKDGENFSQIAKCTNLKTVKDYFNKLIYFDIMYPEYYFVPDDLEKPLRISYKDYYYALNINIQKTDRLFFKEVILSDDQGWIITDPNEKIMYGAADQKSDFSFYDSSQYGVDGTPSSFYSINFYMQKNYDKIFRSYMKFQDFAAIIGGFMKIVLVIGGLFSFLFNDIIRDEIIYNLLFEYRPLQKEIHIPKLNFDHETPHFRRMVNFNLNNSINSDNSNNNDLFKVNQIENSASATVKHMSNEKIAIFKISQFKPNLNVLNEYENSKLENNNFIKDHSVEKDFRMFRLKYSKTTERRKSAISFTKHSNFKFKKEPYRNSLKFGIWFSIKFYACRFFKNNPEKEKIYVFLKNYLKERLDVLHYLKTLETIDRMKLIFFNHYQSMSFEFLKTPNLCSESELENLDLEFNKDLERDFNDLVDYFSHRMHSKELDEIDQKLLNFIDPEIKRLSSV
jgi:hypothetical protein